MGKSKNARCTDAEFLQLWEELGSPAKMAKKLNVDVRCIYLRRRRIEGRHLVQLESKNFNTNVERKNYRNLVRKVKGPVIVFSDAHVSPDEPFTPAYWALLELIKRLQPSVIVANGDIFDCAAISRFPPINNDPLPSIAEELDMAKLMLGNIEKVAPKNCSLIFTIGNHDQRWATRLASVAKEFKGINGLELSDHLPSWEFSWSLILNEGVMGGETLIKHRMNNGIHGAYNNVLRSGLHVVTGHSHALRCVPYQDFKTRRYAVECGMLSAKPIDAGSKFLYAEDNVSQCAIGFAVLTYDENYKLLPPELVEVLDNGKVYFRGEELKWKK